MKSRIALIERKYWGFVSIEKVFEQVAAAADPERFLFENIKLSYDNNLSGIIKNLLYFRKPAADVYHITGHVHYMALVLPPAKTVLTIHDLGFLHIRRGLRRWILKKLFLDWPLARMRYVTAISEATRDEIVRYARCAPERVRVVENPLPERFRRGRPRKIPARPTILQIGTLPNKNLPVLFAACEGLDCRLRIIGRLDAAQVADLKTRGIEYENAFELSDEDLICEYEKADIVTFCSTYEGFGMPVIEAQAMCRPVVTSDLRPLRDVAGEGGARLVDPHDPAALRAALRELIADESLAARLVEQGLANVERFEARTIARKYEEIYGLIRRGETS